MGLDLNLRMVDLLLDRDEAPELRSHTAQEALLAEHRRLSEQIAAEDTRLSLDEARLSLLGRAIGGAGTGITYVVLAMNRSPPVRGRSWRCRAAARR
jgi:hypothetical protein